jgi:hypothetical protein
MIARAADPMRAPILYLNRLRKYYLALKLKWDNDKAISRTRSRWDYAMRHPAAPTEKPQK